MPGVRRRLEALAKREPYETREAIAILATAILALDDRLIVLEADSILQNADGGDGGDD